MHVAPGGVPQNVTVDSSNGTNIEISWNRVECLKRNSEIAGYNVTFGRSIGGSM